MLDFTPKDLKRLLRKVFYSPGEKILANLREPVRKPADNAGHVITSVIIYVRKLLITNDLEARGVEPLFPMPTSAKIQERLYRRGLRESKPSWKCLDGAGCY